MTVKSTRVVPIQPADRHFGAEIYDIDVANLSEEDFLTIYRALYTYNVIVLKNQEALTPEQQFRLTQRFDPTASSYGHGKTLDAKRSVLHPDLKTCPTVPAVQIIGNGKYDEYEGLEDFTLKHPHHRTFHKEVIPDEEDLDFTRFYRWHIDAALYDLNPPKVTSLLAVKVPAGRTQTVRYDDGTGDEMQVSLGTTAFVSGYEMYDLLSETDKSFVRHAKIEYAPHPYIWMSPAKSRSNGLGILSEGLEVSESQLPVIEQDKIKVLPFLWKNELTGEIAFQVHPSAIRAIIRPDGSRMTELSEVRELVYRLQRPGIAPNLVYAHDWKEGDCVLFHNRGTLHSVVGAFAPDEQRLFRQCNIAASEGVTGPDGLIY